MFFSRKTFQKTSKNNRRSRKKQQKKTIKKYGKQLVQCNDLVKKETFAN